MEVVSEVRLAGIEARKYCVEVLVRKVVAMEESVDDEESRRALLDYSVE
jgi:hypothetical protein